MVRILRGKRGDFKFVAGGIIALISILLLTAWYAPARKIANTGYETGKNVEKDLGLDDLIPIPKIASNTLRLNDEKWLVADFVLNKAGRNFVKDGGDIRVVFSARKLPDDSLRDVCTNVRKPRGDSQDDANRAKGFDCEVSDEGSGVTGGSSNRALLKSWISGKEGPVLGGEYSATVSIRGKGDKDFRESKESPVYKFYTEDYVELLDKPINGCNGGNNCNVIECKKTIMNEAAATATAGPEVKRISKELALGTCVKYDPAKALKFDFSNCNKNQVDDFNTKVARLRMFIAASNTPGLKKESEYSKYADKVAEFEKFGIDNSLACSRGEGNFKGAYGYLDSLGWKAVGDLKNHENAIKAALDEFLAFVYRPTITKLFAGVGTNNKQIALGWSLPLGGNTLTRYQLNIYHSNAALDVELAYAKQAGAKGIPVLQPQQPANDKVYFIYPFEGGGLTSAQMGAYWFELIAFDSNGESSRAESHTGRYDNNYLELYRVSSKLNGVDATCKSDCEVIGKKEAALENDNLGWSNPPGKTKKLQKTYVYIARCGNYVSQIDVPRGRTTTTCPAVAGKFSESCQLDLLSKKILCTAEEINVLYKDVVTAYYNDLVSLRPQSLQMPSKPDLNLLLSVDCNKPEGRQNKGWMDNPNSYRFYNENGIKAVCDAKNNLKKSLDGLRWSYTGS